jgi:hypothetical protein
MRNPIILGLATVLTHFAAAGQTAGTAAPSQDTQSGDANGVIGSCAKEIEPVELVPMTASERFRLYLCRTYGPGAILQSAVAGGFAQLHNEPKEWKQGAEGYGERVGSAYGIDMIRGTLQYGAAAALREDDRYIRSRDTGFWKRSKHAVAETFLARNNAGHEHFAFSRFGSAAGASFISRTWQPRSTNTAGDAAVVFGLTIGADVGSNIFHEFWPDIKRHVFKRGE